LRTLLGMGSTRPEREDARARSNYLAAARRFNAAMAAYVAIGVPLAPRRGGAELPAWDRARHPRRARRAARRYDHD
jgi:hypothetical protein